jgi:gamma-glutamylcyclotransferase (GGCT)/AIG2-like uncharacterized protein YtfP
MVVPQLFFFYGTLIAGSGNAVAQATHARLRPVGPASVPGALWAVPDTAGWFPALVAGQGRVHGMLYAAMDSFDAGDLARLDEWEDFRSHQPAASLYLRVEMHAVDSAGRSVAAQVYRFNQPLPTDARAIPGGDFQAWLKATGNTAYAG